ncbi:prostaglandin G/H synthase 2-like [Sipha flava]|uniref:prostaglandin-endoperoxide synthase n=1 Tax=Sipha flava TaxID=143950 RepID=A0A8B8G9S8_9HEMI|nr:prostaglandin G/H synthase 2-like [Sipha flava]
MDAYTLHLLMKLRSAKNRNEISDEEYYILEQSILSNRTTNRKYKEYAKWTNTHRSYFGWTWSWSTVMRELRLPLIYLSIVLFAIQYFTKDHDTKDWSYCDALMKKQCQNGGVLVQNKGVFTCQCPHNYYGELCADERYFSTVSRLIGGAWFDGANEDMRRGAPKMWWWQSLFSTTDPAERYQKTVISFHQQQLKRMTDDWVSTDGTENDILVSTTNSSRILLPARPIYCPVNDNLPPLNTLYDQVFKREKDGGLTQDPKRRNLLYRTFYRYFVMQFFGKDYDSTVTGSQLYGSDGDAEKRLRSMAGGKLKTEYSGGEQYPSRLSFAEKIRKVFTRTPVADQQHWFNQAVTVGQPPRSVFADVYGALRTQWAVANPLLGEDPLLFAMTTLWVREHNRVCDLLTTRWPEWTDDQLYAVARRTVVAQMMAIMMNEVLPAANPFTLKYHPETYRDVLLNTSAPAKTPLELLLTTILPSGLPDGLDDTRQILASGMTETVRFMVDQKMGSLTSNNDGDATMPLTKLLIKLSRENRIKGFNDYRRHFGLRAYKSFYELTENHETANKLISLYGDVDNVELLTGMLTEKKSDNVVPTFTVMINSFIVNSIITNPLGSKELWNADTFGGEYGFDLVKSANIKTLICNNLIDKCDSNFTVDIYAK